MCLLWILYLSPWIQIFYSFHYILLISFKFNKHLLSGFVGCYVMSNLTYLPELIRFYLLFKILPIWALVYILNYCVWLHSCKLLVAKICFSIFRTVITSKVDFFYPTGWYRHMWKSCQVEQLFGIESGVKFIKI